MSLCEKYGGNQRRWEEVAQYLILKSHKEYYSDSVVKCGYYPGKHTVNYVDEVMTRYHGYVITKQEE
jgi:membrane-bound lytic murein transglycosylase F